MRIFLISLVLLFTVQNLSSQDLVSNIQEIADDYGVMGMSLYVNVNGTVTDISVGLRDFDRDLPVTTATQYRIASVSKSFSALGLIKLINDGAIGIDDDISEVMGYLIRNPNFPSTPITPRMLLSHTSGLQDGTGYGPFLSATYNQDPIPNISELVTTTGEFYTSNMWRLEPPGTYFAYSNINFGLIGTVIEAASEQRFDVFMKTEILNPLHIAGSFNIQDLVDINNLSVLYRYNGGWQPQWDNYQGIMPNAPDLSNYTPGTNGAYFAPQGGLRITAESMNAFARALANDGDGFNLDITAQNLQLMKAIAWDYNGNNGDNYGGLFNRWALGLHLANTAAGDVICPSFSESFIGHPGEAYGLVSDNYFIEGSNISFSLLINGVQQGYQVGTSSFYTIEEDIFSAVCSHINQLLKLETPTLASFNISPNPANQKVNISLGATTFPSEILIIDTTGKTIKVIANVQEKDLEIDISTIPTGMYFVQVVTTKNTITQKLIIN